MLCCLFEVSVYSHGWSRQSQGQAFHVGNKKLQNWRALKAQMFSKFIVQWITFVCGSDPSAEKKSHEGRPTAITGYMCSLGD